HAATVQNARGLRNLPTDQPRNLAADDEMSLCGRRRRCSFTGANGPDGLIRHNHRSQFRRVDVMNGAADLAAQYLTRLAIVSFSLVLTDTNNRNEIVSKSS